VLRAIKRYYIANPAVFDHYERRHHCVRQSTCIEGHTADRRQLSLASCSSLRDRPAGVGFQLDQNAMEDAFVVAKRLGITTKSRARDRRPTMDELDKLMMHFGERLKRRPPSVPMQRIAAFAIFFRRVGWRKSLASIGPTLMPEEVGC
jgi:hypothetical protein